MRQSGHWASSAPLSIADVLNLLDARMSSIDLEHAKADAAPFISDTRPLDLWSREFFLAISRERLKER